MSDSDTSTLQGAIAYAVQDDNPLSNIAAFYFDIISEHAINVRNQITDNYVEDNTSIQDHIAHCPIEITLKGLIGEKVFKLAETDMYSQLLENAQKATASGIFDKLSSLEVLMPEVSNLEQLARNACTLAESTYNRYKGIIQAFGNSNNPLNAYNGTASDITETRLEEVYRKLLVFRENNTPMYVETPYKTFQDMYIQSIIFTQGNENYVSDIEISFKQMRFAEVETTAADEEVMSKYNDWARAEEENHGTTQGKTANSALYSTLVSGSSYINN